MSLSLVELFIAVFRTCPRIFTHLFSVNKSFKVSRCLTLVFLLILQSCCLCSLRGGALHRANNEKWALPLILPSSPGLILMSFCISALSASLRTCVMLTYIHAIVACSVLDLAGGYMCCVQWRCWRLASWTSRRDLRWISAAFPYRDLSW